MIIRKKTAKTKCKFRGEEFFGPQASLRVTPCPPATNQMHFNGRSAACTQQHTLIRSGNCEFLWGPVYHRKLHPNVRARHVDILRKRLPPSNLYCLSKDDELEMDNTIKRMKRGKKRGKTVKEKQIHFYFKEKESLPATSEQQKILQDSEYN